MSDSYNGATKRYNLRLLGVATINVQVREGCPERAGSRAAWSRARTDEGTTQEWKANHGTNAGHREEGE
jgi:hypothetical protein